MQNGIGNIGFNTEIIDVALTVQAAAYATGDIIGGKIIIPNALARDGGSGILESVVLNSASDFTVNLELLLFSADPTATTFTENGPVAIAAGDVAKMLGVVNLSTRYDVGTPVIAPVSNLRMPVKSAATRNLWACLIARGAITPAATTDLMLRLGILRDQ
jgi:hypothetical protein